MNANISLSLKNHKKRVHFINEDRQRYYSSVAATDKAEPLITNDTVHIEGRSYPVDELTNVTPSILLKTTRRLHLHVSHPISILRNLIEQHYPNFQHLNTLSPIVSTAQNFDDLGFPEDHPGRKTTDSYYINKDTMLRTHTSAHQLQVLRSGADKFLISADVYRRDEIDSSHYPVFHQMEGVQVFDIEEAEAQVAQDIAKNQGQVSSMSQVQTADPTVITEKNPIQSCHPIDAGNAVGQHLKHSLNGIVRTLFKEEKELRVRWTDSYFPFTSPSWEMEVFYEGKWLEICGCGVILQEIMNNAGRPNQIGWAFGLGLERIAMVLFGIPDIRLFWSQDSRFLSQFTNNKIIKFHPFSKYPSCIKDISFWLGSGEFHENNFCDLVRDIAGDLIEDVKLVDEFTHPKNKRRSLSYRMNYRSMDRNITHEEINEIHGRIGEEVQKKQGVILR
ncbi:hypothetical protein G9A89_020678 [Geosiphon pyriformis]|nr:hypothetical protein G9A89_020678 [Geosiphon pyriformis]